MSKYEHTFHYDSEADFVQQLDVMLQKLLRLSFEPYEKVRSRYGLKPTAFCMRLRRFMHRGGYFPHTTGEKGKRIISLAITPALHAHLSK